MATFALALVIFRTPRLPRLYLSEVTDAEKKEFEGKLRYWTDFGFLRKGPSYLQKIKLLEQFHSFSKVAKKWKSKCPDASSSVNLNINGDDVILINPTVDHFLQALEDTGGPDAKITIKFRLEHTFDYPIGPFRNKKAVLTVENTLSENGKHFTSEIVEKKLRTTYAFFSRP
jgi:hypothetical protein